MDLFGNLSKNKEMNHMTVDGPDAPWCQEDPPYKEIEVTVSVTLSKTLSVRVNDYSKGVSEDENGKYINYDFSDCNLRKAVEEQVVLPQESFKDWSVDDFEVVPE